MSPFLPLITWLTITFGVGCISTSTRDKTQLPILPSKAAVDGPHVFYKNQSVVVKCITPDNNQLILQQKIYTTTNDILLTCTIPDSNESFSFGLMDSILPPPTTTSFLPDKILVLSDIEGNFEAFKRLLLGAGVLNNNFEWSFGKGHLVLLGDYFDRGAQVTECLWLAYKLEQEARLAGGEVHFILGNHEIMNLAGQAQYVHEKYLKNAKILGEPYEAWYSQHTELGRWLRSKNAIEKIGNLLFCHGGISPELANSALSLDEINQVARKYYGKNPPTPDNPERALIFDTIKGPFWYRDMARQKIDQSSVDKALNTFKAEHLIIGHTLCKDIQLLYNQKIICIDVFHEENLRMGLLETLLIENGCFYKINSNGAKTNLTPFHQQ
jgi:hypothetical protein